MKNLAPLVFVTAVSLLMDGTLRAQDAAAPMRRNSPAPTETPPLAPPSTATPAPAATPRLQASPPPASTPSETQGAPAQPAPTPKAERATTAPADAPAKRSVLRPPPVRALERGTPFIRRAPAPPNDGPRASRPTFDLSESNWATAATIRSLEKRWAAAIKNHDAKALDALLAENFSGTSATGSEASKERMLALLRRDKNVYKSVRVHGMSVRNLGPTTAVVTGTATESGVTEDGRKFKVSRRFTDTWRQRGGRWQCVASRVTQGSER